MPRLVLLRHGESEWNKDNRFCGWFDVRLSSRGEEQALLAGKELLSLGFTPTVVHTSVKTRSITTANLILGVLDRLWIPGRRSWRLNERHYGALTGLNKAETMETYGKEQVQLWRRGYNVRPPPMPADHPWNPNLDERYAQVPKDLRPTTECLADVVTRVVPYWYDSIWADLHAGHDVLVVGHGTPTRALVQLLLGLADDSIRTVEVPNGRPLLFDFDEEMRLIHPERSVEERLEAGASSSP